MSPGLYINEDLTIRSGELVFRAARAGGPGGQHVNTSATRVELIWDVAASASLDEDQRGRLMARLRTRLDSRGVLRMVESRRRSQLRNREAVTERFAQLIASALKIPKRRKKTRPPRGATEQRIREKKHRSDVKRRRGPVGPQD